MGRLRLHFGFEDVEGSHAKYGRRQEPSKLPLLPLRLGFMFPRTFVCLSLRVSVYPFLLLVNSFT